MPSRETTLTRWRTFYYAAWAAIGIAIIAGACLYGLGRISSALAPFILAFLFVFVLQGPTDKLERRGVPRGVAVGAMVLLAVLAVVVLAVFIAQPVSSQFLQFTDALPGYLKEAQSLFTQAQEKVSTLIIPDWVRSAVASFGDSLSRIAVTAGNSVAGWLVSAGSGIATVVFDLFLGVVIAFWTTKDLPKIRRELKLLAGDKYEDDLENLLATIGRMVGGYTKGQTIASLTTGTLAGIGLAIIGVPYAVVLGMIVFVLNYVPYVGPMISGLLAAALGLLQGPLVALGAIAVVLIAQNLTDFFVTPRVMSKQVDLHPTLVIFSLLVGGALMGFWGMIFAIPVAATLKALFVYYWERKTSRQLATEDGALFRTTAGEEETADTPDGHEHCAGEVRDDAADDTAGRE